MQKIEKIVKRTCLTLIIFMLLATFLIEYSFNIGLFPQVIIIALNLIAIFVLGYFYFNPKFVIQKRKEIILLISVLFIFFVLMETTLQMNYCGWDWDVSIEEEVKYKYEKSKEICNPVKELHKKFRVMSNNEGFIDDDFEFNEGDYNIFLIGDSFAACLESDYENCVHQKLEKDLKKEYSENINIMNFGVSGYGGAAELAILKTYKDEYKPKMIILYFLDNDFSDNENLLHKSYVESKKRRIIRAMTPKTLLFVMTNGKKIVDKIFIKSEAYRVKTGLEEQHVKNYEVFLEEYDDKWQNLVEDELEYLEEIYQISSEENIILLHVAVTSREQVYEEDWEWLLETYPSLKDNAYILSKPNEIVMNFAKKNRIHNLDLVPLFKENPKYLHLPVDGHWNDEGQIFAGEKIKEYIIENSLIKNV